MNGNDGREVAVSHGGRRDQLPTETIDVPPLSAQVDATIPCVGLYGLLAYSVAQRVKEIGIRMALGAQRKQVTVHVLGGAAQLVVIGIAVGAPAAWAASRWVESMLFGLKPTDPAATAGAIVLLVTAAQVAAYLPAQLAARVDPMAALRHE